MNEFARGNSTGLAEEGAERERESVSLRERIENIFFLFRVSSLEKFTSEWTKILPFLKGKRKKEEFISPRTTPTSLLRFEITGRVTVLRGNRERERTHPMGIERWLAA